MPGLREEVISIICEEWPKRETRETPLNATTISERLKKAGGSASEAEVQLELRHLVDQRLITLDAMTVGSVSPELCL
jgi:hypothetical protein